MLRVHHRPPELLPPHQRDFPPRETTVPELSDTLHVRDTRLLMLVVTGYVLSMLGGIIVLHALSPVSHATIHPSGTADVKTTDR